MDQDTGILVRWMKHEGDHVTQGEPIMEIETDKVVVEIEATASGVLANITAAEGDEIPVGQVIAQIIDENLREGRVTKPPDRILASPKARREAAERGIDLASLHGSGPEGAVLAVDMQASGVSQAPSPQALTPQPPYLAGHGRADDLGVDNHPALRARA
jgi:pyruvate dehydrogenase E2 component (dihydrolipoamide acetyltransferase)